MDRASKDKRARRVTIDQIIEAAQAEDNIGFCIACGHEQFGCEPDARGYTCEECGKNKVFGAEELLIIL